MEVVLVGVLVVVGGRRSGGGSSTSIDSSRIIRRRVFVSGFFSHGFVVVIFTCAVVGRRFKVRCHVPFFLRFAFCVLRLTEEPRAFT